jgi:hypothetical protein
MDNLYDTFVDYTELVYLPLLVCPAFQIAHNGKLY